VRREPARPGIDLAGVTAPPAPNVSSTSSEEESRKVKPESPEAHAAEARLRKRYDDLWADVRRELEKQRAEKYEDLVQGTPDPEDVGSVDVLIDMNLTEIDRDVEELRAVQDAISRLKRGKYGICRVCGREIPPKRLEALPYAALCVEDQERVERGKINTPSL
jgi:RNA polymerase-binding protein DksA